MSQCRRGQHISSYVIAVYMYVDITSITTIMVVYIKQHRHYHYQHSSQSRADYIPCIYPARIRVSSHPADSKYHSQDTHLDTRSSLIRGIGRSRRFRWSPIRGDARSLRSREGCSCTKNTLESRLSICSYL
jgi:hypothetical protein